MESTALGRAFRNYWGEGLRGGRRRLLLTAGIRVTGIRIERVTLIAPELYRVRFSVDQQIGARVRAIVNHRSIGEVRGGEVLVPAPAGSVGHLLLLADSAPSPRTFPPTVIVQWFGVADAAYYVVEQNTPGGTVEAGRVAAARRQYHSFLSDAVPDGETHSFRVTAISAINASETVIYDPSAYGVEFEMATYPAEPGGSIAWDSANVAVVT